MMPMRRQRTYSLLGSTLILCLGLGLVEPLVAQGGPPPNDSCSSPTVVTLGDPAAVQSTTEATIDFFDPALMCLQATPTNTVWFEFTAPETCVYNVVALGSGFDPVLAVWDLGTLDCPTPRTELACNDDRVGTGSSRAASVNVFLRAGQVVLIENASTGTPLGGDLQLTIRKRDPSTLTFEPHRSLETGTAGPKEVVTGDFNGDSHPDIVFYNFDFGFTVHLGDGRGNFTPGQRIPFPVAHSLRAGDFNGDGEIDLLLLRPSARVLEVFLGQGDGTFLGPVTTEMGVRNLRAPAIGDFNEDGLDDVAVSQGRRLEDPPSVVGLAIRLADGTGSFTPLRRLREGETTVAADFDRDGHVDLAVNDGELRTYPGLGNGDFGSAIVESIPSTIFDSGSKDSMVVTDIDGDGFPEVFADAIRIECPDDPQNPPGFRGYGVFGQEPVRTDIPQTHSIGTDLNGDGLGDVVSLVGDTFFILRGTAEGTLAFPIFLHTGGGVSVSSRLNAYLASADFDHDGEMDLVLGGLEDTTGRVFLNRTRGVLYAPRTGNVNGGAGAPVDVLFVNASAGMEADRVVPVAQGGPLTVEVDAPPSAGGGTAPFVLYAYPDAPTPLDTVELRFGLGAASRPFPFHRPTPGRPRKIWNNIVGFDELLGTADLPSSPAPSVVLQVAAIQVTGEFTLQGLIMDPDAPNGQAAVTNAVIVKVE